MAAGDEPVPLVVRTLLAADRLRDLLAPADLPDGATAWIADAGGTAVKRFAELIDALIFTPSRNGKIRLMGDYFSRREQDRPWS